MRDSRRSLWEFDLREEEGVCTATCHARAYMTCTTAPLHVMRGVCDVHGSTAEGPRYFILALPRNVILRVAKPTLARPAMPRIRVDGSGTARRQAATLPSWLVTWRTPVSEL